MSQHQRGEGCPPGATPEPVTDDDRAEQRLPDQQHQPGVAQHLRSPSPRSASIEPRTLAEHLQDPQRRPSDEDRRRVDVEVTGKGAAIWREAMQGRDRSALRLPHVLTPAERQTLAWLQRRLTLFIEEVRWLGRVFASSQRRLSVVTGCPVIVVLVTDPNTPEPAPESAQPQSPMPAWRPSAENPYGQPEAMDDSATRTLPPLGTPTPQRRPRQPRRLTFAAGVVAAALVVGGGAGIGGAAAYTAWHDSDDNGSTPTSVTTSQVVSSSSTPASTGSVQEVAAKVLPSVVKIDVSGPQGSGSGSGIILSSDGQILTNNHVVELAGDSGTLEVSFNDGSRASATILGTDPLTDTALIQAQGVSGLTPATIGKSSDLAVGQGVVAIGSPFGLESTVTSGIVSALDRAVDVGSDDDGNATVYPAIQTDAAINPGNSGGALVDLNGNVVGINASIRTASSSGSSESGSIGLGFAIPIDEVLPIIDEMANGATPTHARLGIQVSVVGAQTQEGQGQGGLGGLEDQQQDSTLAEDGAQIQEVGAGSTASQAGLAVGDVITKVDDHLITDPDSLIATIRSYRPGDQVTVTYTRDGQTKTAQLTLDSDADTSTS